MSDVNEGFVISEIKPKWVEEKIPMEWIDEELLSIIMFFVIHSPCKGQSAKSISLQ